MLIHAPCLKRPCMLADNSAPAMLNRSGEGALASSAPISRYICALAPRRSSIRNSASWDDIDAGGRENAISVVRTTSSRPRYDNCTARSVTRAGR